MHRFSAKMLCFSSMLLWAFGFGRTSLAETAPPPKSANSPLQIPPVGLEPLVDPDLESKIVDLYAENKCPVVREIVKASQFSFLKPITLAIVAYCQSDTKVAEKLFEQAEKRDPSSDVVVALHATEEGKGLASELMSRLCMDAGIRKVTLTFELVKWQKNTDKSRHLLEKSGFRCMETIDEVEIWVRRAGA